MDILSNEYCMKLILSLLKYHIDYNSLESIRVDGRLKISEAIDTYVSLCNAAIIGKKKLVQLSGSRKVLFTYIIISSIISSNYYFDK